MAIAEKANFWLTNTQKSLKHSQPTYKVSKLKLKTGKWTSKLGSLEDIEHNNLQGLTGNPGYGEIGCIMKKIIPV